VKSGIVICLPPCKLNGIDERLISTGLTWFHRAGFLFSAYTIESWESPAARSEADEVCGFRIHSASLRVRDFVEFGDAGVEYPAAAKRRAGDVYLHRRQAIVQSSGRGDAGHDHCKGRKRCHGLRLRLPGGLGGRAKATIAVTPGERLAIFVGATGGNGGFNGGGNSQNSSVGGGRRRERRRPQCWTGQLRRRLLQGKRRHGRHTERGWLRLRREQRDARADDERRKLG
jgi:hypothetical protein